MLLAGFRYPCWGLFFPLISRFPMLQMFPIRFNLLISSSVVSFFIVVPMAEKQKIIFSYLDTSQLSLVITNSWIANSITIVLIFGSRKNLKLMVWYSLTSFSSSSFRRHFFKISIQCTSTSSCIGSVIASQLLPHIPDWEFQKWSGTCSDRSAFSFAYSCRRVKAKDFHPLRMDYHTVQSQNRSNCSN